MKSTAFDGLCGVICLLWGAAVAGAADLPSPIIPDGIGINIHFLGGARPGEAELLSDLGSRWIRTDCPWSSMEPQKGVYNFELWEKLLSEVQPQHCRAIAVMSYNNQHYDNGKSPVSDEGCAAFARWFVATAHHFRGRGILWEMYNEPNIDRFWTPKKDVQQYIKLALAVGEAMHKAEPDEQIIGPASYGFDMAFLEACFKAGLLKYWSAVTVHPYRRRDPETVALDYARLRKLIDQFAPKGKDIPIYAGEWGYSNAWKGIDETMQGKLLTREIAVNQANQVPLTIWYDWNDDGANVNEQEENFGLMHHDYVQNRKPVYLPKPSALAFKTLTHVLNGYRFKERLAMEAESDYVFAFEKSSSVRWLAWTTSSRARHVMIPLKAGNYMRLTNTGDPLPVVQADEKGLSMEIIDSPIYLMQE